MEIAEGDERHSEEAAYQPPNRVWERRRSHSKPISRALLKYARRKSYLSGVITSVLTHPVRMTSKYSGGNSARWRTQMIHHCSGVGKNPSIDNHCPSTAPVAMAMRPRSSKYDRNSLQESLTTRRPSQFLCRRISTRGESVSVGFMCFPNVIPLSWDSIGA